MSASLIDQLFDISGSVAVVTGGGQGLGRMIATGLAEAGARVYITSRKAEVAKEAAEDISRSGECIAITADLDSPEAVVALADAIKVCETQVDILVNNAGKTWGASLESFPDKAWPSVMAVNVQGPFTLVRELLPLLKASGTESGAARIINIGSVAGCKCEPIPAYSYSASKAAIQHLSKLLAAELADDGITVNAIVPGYFPTKMTAHLRDEERREHELMARIPLSRLGSPKDIVGMCVFLSSRAGAYITGAELPVDGGLSGCA